jgi:hypothetical protein
MRFVQFNRAPDGLQININPFQVALVTGEGTANATIWLSGGASYLVDRTAREVIQQIEKASG